MAWNDGIRISAVRDIVGIGVRGISMDSGTHDNSLASLIDVDFYLNLP